MSLVAIEADVAVDNVRNSGPAQFVVKFGASVVTFARRFLATHLNVIRQFDINSLHQSRPKIYVC